MLRNRSALIAALLLAAPLATESRAQLFRKSRDKAAAAKQTAEDAAPASPRNRSASVLLRNGIDYLDTYKDPERALQYLKEAQTYQRELSEKERWQLSQAIERASRQQEVLLARRQLQPSPVQETGQGPSRRRLIASTDPARPAALPNLSTDAKADQNLQTTAGTLGAKETPSEGAVSGAAQPPSLEIPAADPSDQPNRASAPPQTAQQSPAPVGDSPGADTIGLTIISQPDDVHTAQPEPARQAAEEPLAAPPQLHPSESEAQPAAPKIVADPLEVPENREAVRVLRSNAPKRAPQVLEEISTTNTDLPKLPITEPATTAVPGTETQTPAPVEEPRTLQTPPVPEVSNAHVPTASEPPSTQPVADPGSDLTLPQLPESASGNAEVQLPTTPVELPARANEVHELPAPPPAVRQLDAREAELPPLPSANGSERQEPQSSPSSPAMARIRQVSGDLPDHVEIHNPNGLREVEEIARQQEEELRRNPPPRRASETTDDRIEAEADSAPLPRAPSPTEARPINPIPVPEEYVPLDKRVFQPYRKNWAAAATCHTPLYFQDAVLERYGQSVEQALGPKWGRRFSYPLDDPRQTTQRNQLLQPAYSTGLFIVQMAAWPFNVIMNPPWEGEYDLGYYRPGDPIPPDSTYWPKLGVGPPLRGRQY